MPRSPPRCPCRRPSCVDAFLTGRARVLEERLVNEQSHKPGTSGTSEKKCRRASWRAALFVVHELVSEPGEVGEREGEDHNLAPHGHELQPDSVLLLGRVLVAEEAL
eukprot:scaffold51605_cov64-Phaeocystis_antarctica.AAC.8